ncbi:hypothetical protein PCL_00046 [Purpureocillium lilacinum]|uniref:Uncharacterized protein n=1 Tax=Purpureocillium lilacinum TaxID=33203 RepID=A0A2U3DP69_PURLI|nr:hypothetical protein PCL_00046 [Purpureocillium lilacinum]
MQLIRMCDDDGWRILRDEGPAAVPCIYLRVSNRQTVFGWASNWVFVGLLEIEIGFLEAARAAAEAKRGDATKPWKGGGRRGMGWDTPAWQWGLVRSSMEFGAGGWREGPQAVQGHSRVGLFPSRSIAEASEGLVASLGLCGAEGPEGLIRGEGEGSELQLPPPIKCGALACLRCSSADCQSRVELPFARAALCTFLSAYGSRRDLKGVPVERRERESDGCKYPAIPDHRHHHHHRPSIHPSSFVLASCAPPTSQPPFFLPSHPSLDTVAETSSSSNRRVLRITAPSRSAAPTDLLYITPPKGPPLYPPVDE